MGRPRKWASEAERLAAYRGGVSVRDVSVRKGGVSVQDGSVSVRIEPPVSVQDVSVRSPGFVRFRHQPHVPLSLFDGVGRGTIRTHTDGQQYVMVSRHAGSDLGELGIVMVADWQARLPQRCDHGLAGWACHSC